MSVVSSGLELDDVYPNEDDHVEVRERERSACHAQESATV